MDSFHTFFRNDFAEFAEVLQRILDASTQEQPNPKDFAEFRIEGLQLTEDLTYPGMGSPAFSAECMRSPFSNTRQSQIAVVRRLFKMGLKSALRRLKTLRRLFHPLLVAMSAMLKNSATLIVSAPRQVVCDAYLRRRQFFGARSAEIF